MIMCDQFIFLSVRIETVEQVLLPPILHSAPLRRSYYGNSLSRRSVVIQPTDCT